jgi:hypothetical protein
MMGEATKEKREDIAKELKFLYMQLTYKGWFWKYRINKHQGPILPKTIFSQKQQQQSKSSRCCCC